MNIKRLLNKKAWTGRELGILELTNTAVMHKQRKEGVKNPVPIVKPDEFRRMLNSIQDQEQARIYDGYISIHKWLDVKHGVANAYCLAAETCFQEIWGLFQASLAAEQLYSYTGKMPLIMTKEQFQETKTQLAQEYCMPGGEDATMNPLGLICTATTYYLENEEEGNPLQALRKKYEKAPVKSEIILSRWNQAAG